MINFKRKGSVVKAEVEANVSVGERLLHFTWVTPDPMWAELLQENLQQGLRLRMEKVRREAYEAGWKNAKAKRRKETWFSGWL